MRSKMIFGAALAAAATSYAAPSPEGALLSPKQQAHMARAKPARTGAVTPQYNYDIKPAVLRAIKVSPKVNAALKNAQAIVGLRLGDNLSGVARVEVTLVSPSGNQYQSAEWYSPLPRTREDLQLGVAMTDASENGTWRVESVVVRDANDYASYYDHAALMAMGTATLEVSGAVGDNQSPQFASAVNLTPTVSLSTPPKGMLPGANVRVGVQATLTDSGAAGIRYATVEFCSGDWYYNCFTVSGTETVRGKGNVTMVLGGALYPYWVEPGTYTAQSVYVTDWSGNGWSAHAYYGDDVNQYFDNPVIVVNP